MSKEEVVVIKAGAGRLKPPGLQVVRVGALVPRRGYPGCGGCPSCVLPFEKKGGFRLN